MAESASVHAGREALEAREWAVARARFEAALSQRRSADALDGLGRALWWSKEPAAALDARAQAYAAFRAESRAEDAVRTAVWLAREHRILYRNHPVADGWLARARSVAGEVEGASSGWVSLAESEAAIDMRDALALAVRAREAAAAAGDADLEIAALARCAVLEVTAGDIDEGLGHVNEAMAAATAGESRDPQLVGEAFCALTEIAALLADEDLLAQWGAALTAFRSAYDFPLLAPSGGATAAEILSPYCGACCGGFHLVVGRLADAERELAASVAALEAAGMHSRCVHPVTKLAEVRIAQGRLAEARLLLSDYEDQPECLRPLAALDLAENRPGTAVARLRPGIQMLRDQPLRAAPLWSLLVEAQIDLGDLSAAAAAVDEVIRAAALTRSRVHAAEALLVQGTLAAARGEVGAPSLLREAARGFGRAGMPLAACRARLAYARSLADSDRSQSVIEARATLAAVERLGARREADAAAALLRSLGAPSRIGARRAGVLSDREQEVLRLLATGLTNGEIAQRLFISTKTAGHHVSSILLKLGVRSRTEAAAYAVLHEPNGADE